MSTAKSEKRLAILVPAWKAKFLHESLSSIAAQTCQDFDCYVFDDAGPSDIKEIATQFPSFNYYRFPQNLGQVSLVAHLNRCLESVNNEWVWMFSDDDVMSAECVESFYIARKKHPDISVFQLPVDMVTEDLGKIIWTTETPAWETVDSYITARFNSERLSCLPDHIFSWKKLRTVQGGLVDFPLAWNSDDATWLLLGQEKGLARVDGAKVKWRQSDSNISSAGGYSFDKLKADVSFLQWLSSTNLSRPSWTGSHIFLARRMVVLYKMRIRDCFRSIRVLPLRWKMASLMAMLHYLLTRFNIVLLR